MTRLLIDDLAAQAWPALEQQVVDGWLLRAATTAGGEPVTKRANSALPPGGPGELDTALRHVQAFYDDRGLPALVQVCDPGLAQELDARGWQELAPTLAMAGPVPAGAAGQVADRPDDAWLTCWWEVDGRAGAPGLAVAQRCLAQVAAPSGYAGVRVAGQVVAVGRGVVQDGWLGVFAMAVLPAHRRRGLGRQVLGALAHWGDALGATSTYLLVEQGNVAARRLYERAGLQVSHGYHYRRSPS